ncbi:MAG: hypothetical protein KBS57_05310 [Alistipes sp.]|nr:hypothetical protein [Candidatus Minthomonas equi]
MPVTEKHHILSGSDAGELLSCKTSLLKRMRGFDVVFQRYFLSTREQMSELPDEEGAVSYIVQPPLGGQTVALWLYLVKGADVSYGNGVTYLKADGMEHIWISSLNSGAEDAHSQTLSVFEECSSILERKGCSLADDCVRTWVFVDDIDRNYADMVDARREYFDRCGLTPETHYIASTGICGCPAVKNGAVIQMDAYAIKGDVKHRYLYAPTHLNPTYEYGVTFERGVRVDYSGRRHVLISGTASIDNGGNVLYPGDVSRQTLRMLENVEVLLAEAESGWDEVRMSIVYIRNAEDYEKVAEIIRERLGNIPYVITLAPVCRPQWLVEMECIGIE